MALHFWVGSPGLVPPTYEHKVMQRPSPHRAQDPPLWTLFPKKVSLSRILGHERPGWCYPTGRCAYLPSVTCYRQSIKPPPPPPPLSRARALARARYFSLSHTHTHARALALFPPLSSFWWLAGPSKGGWRDARTSQGGVRQDGRQIPPRYVRGTGLNDET